MLKIYKSDLYDSELYLDLYLACLMLDIDMKKTLKLGSGRQPQTLLQFFLNVSFKAKINLHTENQPLAF